MECLGAGAAFVSAEADANDGGIVFTHLGSFPKDAVGLFHGEVPYGIEDPVNRKAQFAGGAVAGALERGKDRLKCVWIEIAPHIDDADRDKHLSVNDALPGKLFRHAPRHQLVIFRIDETPGDGFESLDEAGEIVEVVIA